jgi:hypothetical protein
MVINRCVKVFKITTGTSIVAPRFRRSRQLKAAAAALPAHRLFGLIAAVRGFIGFTPDNDRFGQRDFGAVDLDGDRRHAKGRVSLPVGANAAAEMRPRCNLDRSARARRFERADQKWPRS